ncbi:MAG: hypothetical protein JNK48_28740 [Bryobacterales bacterium]|nr:hypothetical protein [Bryobacterales bacterium]
MTQDSVLLIAAAATAGMAGGFGLLLATLRRPGKSTAQMAAREPLRLRPMERLLREEDFAFLAGQPGYRPEIGKQLRLRRLALFRAYLAELSAEFHDLHRKLRLLALYAPTDRTDLARVLMEQRMLFGYRMMEIELRLMLFRFGMKPVDVSGLVEMVETMRGQVGELSAGLAPQSAAVTA